jgi:hypothetical protein
LIETLSEDFRERRLIAEPPFSTTSLTQVEILIQVMAQENRFNRRILAGKFLEFLEMSKSHNVRSRLVPSLSGVCYVFLAFPHDVDRKYRMAELTGRCYVARGLDPSRNIVIGIATEKPEPNKGCSIDAIYFRRDDWTDTDQQQFEYLQKEFGYFTSPRQTRLREAEYPGA